MIRFMFLKKLPRMVFASYKKQPVDVPACFSRNDLYQPIPKQKIKKK